MNLQRYNHIYFLGIGGIGMSALARYFVSRGKQVAGYDRTPSELTKTLTNEGIQIHYTDSVANINRAFRNIEDTLVVYTPAIPADSEELAYFTKNGFDVHKRAIILAEIANNGNSIAVGGTHGKTTTSSLITHIFNQSKPVASAFLGGIAKNSGTNFIAGSSNTVILEADEFDRSFHALAPNIALITAMDADHLDIYGTEANIREAFVDFANRVKPEGKLIHKYGLPLNGITYGLVPMATYSSRNTQVAHGRYEFELVTPHGNAQLTCGLPGRHNVENAVGAAAACLEFGLSLEAVVKGIISFKGVARRFEVRINNAQCTYIDDYAHHPEEIRALLSSVREMFPNKKITAIFQPHLYSRTRDFAAGFAETLSLADELVLLDIYPAREEPIPGVTGLWLFNKIAMHNKHFVDKRDVPDWVKQRMPEVLITLGAGDIDRLAEPLTQLIKQLC